jgi:hypothetical protein
LSRNLIVSSTALCALIVLSAVFAPPVTAADLLLFPSLTAIHQPKTDTELAAKKFVPAVDIFYATEFSQTRFLLEYLASSREKDLERFQFGWHISPGKSLWVGRFHNALSFWNTQMHHGDFLQSSLSRPTVANYEDQHGPIPAHISGFLLESSRTVGDSEINYTAGSNHSICLILSIPEKSPPAFAWATIQKSAIRTNLGPRSATPGFRLCQALTRRSMKYGKPYSAPF